jgi:hypothetical protein
MLMRGDDGSLILLEVSEPPNDLGYQSTTKYATFYMSDGRVITFRPEPLRISYNPLDNSVTSARK